MARDPNSENYPRPGAVDAGSWQQAVPGRAFTVAALTFAAVATLIPLVPGVAALAFAVSGRRRGDPLGRAAFHLAWVATMVGFVVLFLADSLEENAAWWVP